MQNTTGGTVACGHPDTAAAATEMLAEGGNAFDAVLAALAAAFAAEPVLASPGGGGFLLAAPAAGAAAIYDFFCTTPGCHPDTENVDFYPISADFGTTVQEFHIGRASVAVPGVVAGMFEIHRELCTLPMSRLLEPAIRLASRGVVMNTFQAHILDVVSPIFQATASARAVYHPQDDDQRLPREGEVFRQPQLADTLAALATEGQELFYQGDIATAIVEFCSDGGLLRREDLDTYQVLKREPLSTRYRDATVLCNPLPSSGGILVNFGLQLMQGLGVGEKKPGDTAYQRQLAQVMAMTERARIEVGLDQEIHQQAGELLDPVLVDAYIRAVREHAATTRGTTHISVVDRIGNEASLTVSNGEGCGEMLASTGIMLNNMLGEEDLHPKGFHCWPTASRMTSMMSPTLMTFADGRRIALGSGGSNRIRTAILQVILNVVDGSQTLETAIAAPRMHLEGDLLSIEPGFSTNAFEALTTDWPNHHLWQTPSVFFGGVHAVERWQDSVSGAGDPRRGGVSSSI